MQFFINLLQAFFSQAAVKQLVTGWEKRAQKARGNDRVPALDAVLVKNLCDHPLNVLQQHEDRVRATMEALDADYRNRYVEALVWLKNEAEQLSGLKFGPSSVLIRILAVAEYFNLNVIRSLISVYNVFSEIVFIHNFI